MGMTKARFFGIGAIGGSVGEGTISLRLFAYFCLLVSLGPSPYSASVN
jgi:hypothetical protein